MKNNTMRTSLVKSAVLLVVISLIIYLTISTPDGSVWSAIGTIIYTVFKTIQLVIGLVLALLVCLVVLAGIFFGGVAMLSTESAAKMYSQLRRVIKDGYHSFRSCIPGISLTGKSGNESDIDCISQMNENFLRLDQEIAAMKKNQALMENDLRNLQARLESNEQEESITRLSDWLRAEEEKTSGVQEKIGLLGEQMQQVKDQIQRIGEKLAQQSSGDSLGDITERIAAHDKKSADILADLGSLREQVDLQGQGLSAVQQQLHNGSEKGQKATSEKNDQDAHRIFSYIENDDDKEKIVELASEAVQQDMTYARATEYITGKISKKSGEIINEHPTLTQDFLREVRKKF